MFGPPPPPPRDVSFDLAGWNAKFLLMFGGGFAFVPMLMAVFMSLHGAPPWADWAIDKRGKRAEATGVEVRTTSTSLNDHDLFDLVVRFTDRRGKSHTVVLGSIDDARIAAVRAHRKVSIEYDPQQPEHVRFVGSTASMMGPMIWLPVAFSAVGFPLFLLGLASAVRDMLTYRRGLAAEAVVRKVVATGSEQNDEPVMMMKYEAQTPHGVAHGGWKTVKPEPVGAKIWIVYDPANPSRNVPSRD